ncbi:cytochrome C552 [Roseibium sp. RKSG952]|nr:cytochrome C552 [Roseibium sp. RKSG952]
MGTIALSQADAWQGKRIALQWCASCHLVSEDQQVASDATLPSFYEISINEEWTRETLSTFLADPHPVMPDMNLTIREIADITEYIDSLPSN